MPLLLAFAILTAPPVSSTAPLSACGWVRAENEAAGTGFVIDSKKKLFITCRHLVGDRVRVDVIFPWIRDGQLVTDRKEYLANRVLLRDGGLLVTGRVIKTSDDLDLALLELESLPPGTTAATLAGSIPHPGDSLQMIGNRIDLETVWNGSAGPLRASGRLADGYFWRAKKLAANANVLIGQWPIEEGDSGGPVFDARGEVVAMVAALRRQAPLAAVAISACEIRAFAGLDALPAREKPASSSIAEALHRATVWVRPTATDLHLAGTLIGRDLVLTTGKGLVRGDRVGIALPIREGKRWIAERAAYRDPVALQLKGHWRGGTVIARDTERDLAVIRLDSPITDSVPLKLSAHLPATGKAIHTMNHPGGLEFAWVYSAGVMRQQGRLAIALGEGAKPVTVLLCQLPAQTGSPGGAVVNEAGELVGIVAAKESAQMVGYAIAANEIAAFLDVALVDRPARTWPGLIARLETYPGDFSRGLASGLARRAWEHCAQRRIEDAERDARAAVPLDDGCSLARRCLAVLFLKNGMTDAAMAELDAAIEKGSFDRDGFLERADLANSIKDWRKARGDLERILDVNPADAEARQRLANVLLELGEDDKAATAITDTLRADAKRLKPLITDLLAQADRLAKKYPDAPSIPAGWLMKALAALKRPEFANALKRAREAQTDADRLTILRLGIQGFVEK